MNLSDQRLRDIVESYFDQELQPGLLEQLETRVLKGGDWLFREGDAGDSLYFLVRGRLQAWAGVDGADPRLLGEIVAGESVGEVGLISGEPRSAGIQAIRDSLLIRIDRTTFENLAKQHPALVIKLAANVGRMLQKSSSGTSASRSLKTIALLPLTDGLEIDEFGDLFTDELARQASVLVVSPDKLADLGAPVTNLPADTELPEDLRHWLSDQEDQYNFVLYRCPSGDSPWTRFAVRQSDIVLMVADAKDDPANVIWEPESLSKTNASIGRRALILLQRDRFAISDTARWLKDRQVNFHLHMEKGRKKDIQRAIRVVTGTATGLVMGGGAARGLAALGVFKALVEAGIDVDWVGGTSIGSIMAGGVAAGLSPEQAIDVSRKSFKGGKPFSDFTIPVISLLRGNRMKRLLEIHLAYQIEDLVLPYYCVSTNLSRGVKNIHEHGSLVDAIRASAALPGVLPPAVVNGELAIDGAILDNLPVDIMKQKPVGTVIAIDFSAPVPAQVDYAETPSPWAILRGRWLPFARRYRVPGLTSIILKATEAGTQEEVRRHGAMADLLIDPQVRRFGMTDVKSFDAIVQAGYERGCELLEGRSRSEIDGR
jgi:predicted acylesterase/phospholipase RssA/CRP-like cAMP-binding protein